MSSLWPAAVRHVTKVLSGTLQDSDVPLLVTRYVTRMMNAQRNSHVHHVMDDAPYDSHSSQSRARHRCDARG